jgi:transposase
MILDQAGYHRADKVKKLNIKFHYLPPCIPNLNPIEQLRKIMNKNVRNTQFFSSIKEFRGKVSNFFSKTLPSIGHTLNNRINNNFQRLNPAHLSLTDIIYLSLIAKIE